MVATAAVADDASKEHPLMPVIRLTEERYEQLEDEVRDYSCTLVKRERVDGLLRDHEHALVLLRHEQTRNGRVVAPFSVYMKFLSPAEIKNREVVYVRGRNGGKLIGRNGGPRLAHITRAMDPRDELAMRDNRYPITELGIKNLMLRLLDVAREELKYDPAGCVVKYYEGAKVGNRKCTVIEVTHPVRESYYRYHLARIFIDDQWRLPIRYASYDWPKEQGGQPRLIEEYTYLDLKFNLGLNDRDFDYRNPNYGFGTPGGMDPSVASNR